MVEDEVIPVDHTTRIVCEQLDEVLILLQTVKKTFSLRFSLTMGKCVPEDVGVFNVTRERIRQIEAKVLRKLRQPSQQNPSRDFIE